MERQYFVIFHCCRIVFICAAPLVSIGIYFREICVKDDAQEFFHVVCRDVFSADDRAVVRKSQHIVVNILIRAGRDNGFNPFRMSVQGDVKNFVFLD